MSVTETFIHSAKVGNLVKVKHFIETGVDVHAGDDFALSRAAANGHTDVVEYLLACGSDPNIASDSLPLAALNGHCKTVQILLMMGADCHAEDDLALLLAARKNYGNIVKCLLEHGATFNPAWTGIPNAMKKFCISFQVLGPKCAAKLMFFGETAHILRHAVRDNDIATVKAQLVYGSGDIDTLFISAAKMGHLEIVKYLLDAGADVHAGMDEALRWSCMNGNLSVANYLLESGGANVHALDDEALKIASSRGNFALVKMLLFAGANVKAQNNIALKLAARGRFGLVIMLLIQFGAKYDPKWSGIDKDVWKFCYRTQNGIVF